MCLTQSEIRSLSLTISLPETVADEGAKRIMKFSSPALSTWGEWQFDEDEEVAVVVSCDVEEGDGLYVEGQEGEVEQVGPGED